MGGAGKEKPEKKRQRVRRHFKPSLGRFVDQYRRTGENAEPKEPSRRRDPETDALLPSPADPAPARPLARRFAVPAVAALALAALIATIPALLGRRGDGPAFEIHAARRPVLVTVHEGGPERLLDGLREGRSTRVEAAVGRVVAAVDKHPGRLVTLTLPDVELCFDALPAPQRRALETAYRDPARTWETALAEFLRDVLDGVAAQRRSAPLSVAGLPVEVRDNDAAAASRANARYAAVIGAVDPLVSDHAYLRGVTTLSEEQLVRSALPEALRHRDGRPLLFQTNGRWRVLIDPGSLDDRRDPSSARLRELVADAETAQVDAAR